MRWRREDWSASEERRLECVGERILECIRGEKMGFEDVGMLK